MKSLFLSSLMVLAFWPGLAQMTVNHITEAEAADLLYGPGVELVGPGISFDGADVQLGRFVGGLTTIGISSGIIIGTGDVTIADNLNGSEADGTDLLEFSGSSGALNMEHPDLVFPTLEFYDVASLTLTFLASSEVIEFSIVFASDEYLEEVPNVFNDVMGVYVGGPGFATTYAGKENVTLVPGTTDFVSIHTVNPGVNPDWYVNNPVGSGDYHTTYDGFTKPIIITLSDLECGAFYTIEFAVADVEDGFKDAAVFIGANAITSDFEVGPITLISPVPPICEGEDVVLSTTYDPTWNYVWSDGQSGLGLNSITTPGVYSGGDQTITVDVTNPAGCFDEKSISFEVHKLDNDPPVLTTFPGDKLYMQNGDELCEVVFSSDDPEEDVLLSVDYPSSWEGGSRQESVPLPGPAPNPQHQKMSICLTPYHIELYGKWNWTITATDNNVCGALSTEYDFQVYVLCPSCPMDHYVDNRHPGHFPFVDDATFSAARDVLVGTEVHHVDSEDHHVVYRYGREIDIGEVDGSDWETIEDDGCAFECLECCTPESQLTWDAPPEVFVLDPDDDFTDNDVFYISDLENQFNAYHAVTWTFEVWENSAIMIPLFRKWYQSSQHPAYPHPFFPCFLFESPTPEAPFNTFFWEGENDDFDYLGPGLYKYRVTINGCKTIPTGYDFYAHEAIIEGKILIPGGHTAEWTDSLYDAAMSEILSESDEQNQPGLTDVSFSGEVFPNPSTGDFLIRLNNRSSETSLVLVSDFTGKIVYSQQVFNYLHRVNLAGMGKGLYLLRIINDEDEHVEKIILH